MTDTPQRQKLLEIAAAAREDEAMADQLHGALETLIEKVPDDPVVSANFAGCVKFRVLVKQLLRELNRLAPSTASAPAAPTDSNPAKAQALVEEWQSARLRFHDDRRRNKDYLEKLALRIYR